MECGVWGVGRGGPFRCRSGAWRIRNEVIQGCGRAGRGWVLGGRRIGVPAAGALECAADAGKAIAVCTCTCDGRRALPCEARAQRTGTLGTQGRTAWRIRQM